MTKETQEVCQICHLEAQEVVGFKCCRECHKSLFNSMEANELIVGTEPLFSAQAMDELSIAIANSSMEEIGLINVNHKEDSIPNMAEDSLCIRLSTYLSFGINVVLLVLKSLALLQGSSYTLISSVADSCLDIIGGIILSLVAHASHFSKKDFGSYPIGKSRLSIVGILVFSVVMACAALFIIIQCITSLLAHEIPEKSPIFSLIVMGITILIKLSMWITYRCLGHPLTIALSEDHRNDVFTNAIGLFMYWGSSNLGWWMDAAGGIILSVFVLISWSKSAYEQSTMLLGKAAPQHIIDNINYLAMHHHPLIKEVEQAIAFQIGAGYFIELHIVIPGHIPLELSHWIGETLQLKIEKINGVERAWVHVDCETHCENEHLLSMIATGKLNAQPTEEP